MKLSLFIGVAALFATSAGAAPFKPSADAIRSHMQFLASDLLEGREAGTRGFDIAASYVANRMLDLGLTPAGDGTGFSQHVPMLAHRSANEGKFTLTGPDGRETVLAFGTDYLPGTNSFSPETRISAPMVFAGYGIVEPRRGRDDYAGLDVKGKIVVILAGAPKGMQGEERAHLGNGRNKRVAAAERGAAGMITLQTMIAEKTRPFGRGIDTWQAWRMNWRDPAAKAFQPGGVMPSFASLSLGAAARLFVGAPVTFDAVLAASETPDGAIKGFDLPSKANITLSTETKLVESSNVAGLIVGSDPKLRGEVIVLTGHLDHVGIGKAKNGDTIYNGAMDNAAGIATLLEVARGLKANPPKRSVMILAVTGEEKGLVGSDYFARHPTVEKSRLVANVNLDMPILSYDFRDIVAFGADRSSIGPAVARAAKKLGLVLTADATPDEGLFTRSDHYRFVEQGIPSVFLKTGDLNGGEAATAAFRKDRYHQADDDLQQVIDWSAGAKFAAINYEIARELANAPQRPAWNAGDFFGTLFGTH